MSNKVCLMTLVLLLMSSIAFSQSQADGPWMTQLGSDGVQIWVDLGYNQAICAMKDSIAFITDPSAGVTGKGAIQFKGNSGPSDRRDWWTEYAFELPQEAMNLLSGDRIVYLYARTIDIGGGGAFNSVYIDFFNDTLGVNEFVWPIADSADILAVDPTSPNHRLGNENSKSPYYQQFEWLWTGYKEGYGTPPWSYPCFWSGLWQVPGEENAMRFRMYERESSPNAMFIDAVIITDDSTWLRTLTDEAGFLKQDLIFNAYQDAMANGTPLKVISGGPVGGVGNVFTKFDPAGYGQIWIDAADFHVVCDEADSITIITDPSAGVMGKGAIAFSGASGASDVEDWWVEYDFKLPEEWKPLMDGSMTFYMYGRIIDIGGGGALNSIYIVVQNDSSGGTNFAFPMPDITGKLLRDPTSPNHRLGNEHSKNAYFQPFEWLWTGYKEGYGSPPWSYPCFWNGLWSIPEEDDVLRIRVYERESGPDAMLLDAFIMTPDSAWLRTLTDVAGFAKPSTIDSLWNLAMTQGTPLEIADPYTQPVSVERKSKIAKASTYRFSQNYPNPFNPSTTFSFMIPKNEFVTVSIYNILGGLIKEVYKGKATAGQHSVSWDGKDQAGEEVTSGIYFYQLRAGDVVLTNKMVLTR